MTRVVHRGGRIGQSVAVPTQGPQTMNENGRVAGMFGTAARTIQRKIPDVDEGHVLDPHLANVPTAGIIVLIVPIVILQKKMTRASN